SSRRRLVLGGEGGERGDERRLRVPAAGALQRSDHFVGRRHEHEPPAAPEIDVRRVESFEDFLAGLEIVLAEGWSDDQRARRRAEAEETYVRRRTRPGGEWLAYIDGKPVAWAGAVACEHGLFLAGAATLREYRGRGCYRALLRERWDDAVRLGTPALVVHAQE